MAGVKTILLTGLLAALSATSAEPSASADGVELLQDPGFRCGFVLLRPEPGRKVPCGTVVGVETGEPAWQVAQWSARRPFDATTTVVRGEGGMVRLANEGRALAFGGAEGFLSLAVNASAEYGDRPRARGEPWIHLLVEQQVASLPRLASLASLRLHVEARRIRAVLARETGHDPRLHAAQFQIFLSVQNREKGSPGFGDYLWFGIPIYDNRHRVHRTYAAPDSGTGKFIYTAASEPFTRGSTHDDGWVVFDGELLPLIREGLATARARGFLKESADESLFRIAALNMGWEVPGTFDVELEIRRLSLRAIPTSGPSPPAALQASDGDYGCTMIECVRIR